MRSRTWPSVTGSAATSSQRVRCRSLRWTTRRVPHMSPSSQMGHPAAAECTEVRATRRVGGPTRPLGGRRGCCQAWTVFWAARMPSCTRISVASAACSTMVGSSARSVALNGCNTNAAASCRLAGGPMPIRTRWKVPAQRRCHRAQPVVATFAAADLSAGCGRSRCPARRAGRSHHPVPTSRTWSAVRPDGRILFMYRPRFGQHHRPAGELTRRHLGTGLCAP